MYRLRETQINDAMVGCGTDWMCSTPTLCKLCFDNFCKTYFSYILLQGSTHLLCQLSSPGVQFTEHSARLTVYILVLVYTQLSSTELECTHYYLKMNCTTARNNSAHFIQLIQNTWIESPLLWPGTHQIKSIVPYTSRINLHYMWEYPGKEFIQKNGFVSIWSGLHIIEHGIIMYVYTVTQQFYK